MKAKFKGGRRETAIYVERYMKYKLTRAGVNGKELRENCS